MGILIEDIMRMLPENAEVVCKHPTMKVQGIKRLGDLANLPDQRFLYVGTDTVNRDLLEAHNINLLLYSADPLDLTATRQNSNIMAISDLQAYNDVVQSVIDILSVQSSLSDISHDMLMIIRNGGDAKKLLKYTYDILNNPLMLVDVSFNYIDSIGTDSMSDEFSWDYAIKNKTLPLDYISHVMNSVHDTPSPSSVNADLRIEKPNEVTSAAQYSMRVLRNTMVLGYIKMLEKNKPVTEYDLQVFSLLSYYLSFSNIEERGQLPNTDSLSENFLRSLLEEHLTDKNEILSRQAMFNIKLYEILYVIVIKFDGAVINNDQIYYTLRKIRSFFAGNIVTWFNNSLIVLYDARDTNSVKDPLWMDRFSRLLITLKCTANFSIPFKALPELHSYYQQAMFCVELRNLFHDARPILRYEDVFEYHMIINLGKHVNLMDLLHPAVATLLELEARGNERSLLETLFIYNRNQCNITSTAKEMFLHYNTMKHRIGRIAELTGFDGSDSRDYFLIALSEKILKVCQCQEENRTNSKRISVELNGNNKGRRKFDDSEK